MVKPKYPDIQPSGSQPACAGLERGFPLMGVRDDFTGPVMFSRGHAGACHLGARRGLDAGACPLRRSLPQSRGSLPLGSSARVQSTSGPTRPPKAARGGLQSVETGGPLRSAVRGYLQSMEAWRRGRRRHHLGDTGAESSRRHVCANCVVIVIDLADEYVKGQRHRGCAPPQRLSPQRRRYKPVRKISIPAAGKDISTIVVTVAVISPARQAKPPSFAGSRSGRHCRRQPRMV
jgi:hypothetical protein